MIVACCSCAVDDESAADVGIVAEAVASKWSIADISGCLFAFGVLWGTQIISVA